MATSAETIVSWLHSVARTTGTNHRDWFESEYDVKLDEIEGLRTRAKQKAVKDWFKEKLPAVIKFLCV
jgi:hypothetical protein